MKKKKWREGKGNAKKRKKETGIKSRWWGKLEEKDVMGENEDREKNKMSRLTNTPRRNTKCVKKKGKEKKRSWIVGKRGQKGKKRRVGHTLLHEPLDAEKSRGNERPHNREDPKREVRQARADRGGREANARSERVDSHFP